MNNELEREKTKKYLVRTWILEQDFDLADKTLERFSIFGGDFSGDH